MAGSEALRYILHNVYYRTLRRVPCPLRPLPFPTWSRSCAGCAIRSMAANGTVAQNFATIAPYTIEEAYEVADAIDREDLEALKDELGDLQLQVVYHARMAEEIGAFALDDVMASICAKMIRRHPHIFGDEAASPGWEALKAAERARARRPERARRSGPRPARPEARGEAPAPCRPDRLRLARPVGAAGEDRRRAGRDRCRRDGGGARRRAWRPLCSGRQLRPPSRYRSGNGAARSFGALRATLPQGRRDSRQAIERNGYRSAGNALAESGRRCEDSEQASVAPASREARRRSSTTARPIACRDWSRAQSASDSRTSNTVSTPSLSWLTISPLAWSQAIASPSDAPRRHRPQLGALAAAWPMRIRAAPPAPPRSARKSG